MNDFKTSDKVSLINSICILYITVWAISPPLAFGTTYRLLLLFSMTILTMINFQKIIQSKITVWVVTYILVTGFVNYHYGEVTLFLRNIQLYIFLFLLIIFDIFKDKFSSKNLHIIFLITILLLTLWNFLSIRILADNTHASRALAKSFEGAEELTNQGIGGFSSVYSQVILIVPILALIRYKNTTTKLRLVYVVYLVSVSILFLKAGYSLAVLITLFSLYLYIIAKELNKVHTITNLILLGFIVLIFNYFFAEIISVLLDITEGTSFYNKVRDIAISLSEEASIGTVDGRMERYQRSIRLFIESPVWGQLDIKDIGKHSQILDNFAQYGLFLGMLFLYFVSYGPKYFLNGRYKKVGKITFITVILLFVTNNMPASLGVTLFLTYPTAMWLLNNNSKFTKKKQAQKK